MTNLEHYDFCKPYIMDGEYILWEGAPEKGFASDNERTKSFLGRYGKIL